MFITEVKIKKTDWHYKLLKFVMGEDNVPKMNFCPYFWLTIFSMIASPFVAVFKAIRFIAFKFLDFIDSIIFIPLEKIKFKQFVDDEDDLYYALLYCHNFDICNYYEHEYEVRDKIGTNLYNFKIVGRGKELYKIYNLFIKNFNGDVDQFIKDLELKREKKDKDLKDYYDKLAVECMERSNKRDAEKAKRDIKKKKIINSIIKLTKIITPVLVGALCILIVIGLSKFVMWLYVITSLKHIKTWLVGLSILTSLILVVSFIIWIIYKIIDKIKSRTNYCSDYKPNIFVRAIDSIKSFFMFFIDFIKAWKSDNCPGIVWEDEKESLEKK